MKCDKCDKQATVFLTQIINGKMYKMNLCNEHAKELGVTNSSGDSLADLLLKHHSEKQQELIEDVEMSKEGACPSCGFTMSDFKKTARLGCPDCYAAFETELEEIISENHKGTRHKGKRPSRVELGETISQRRVELKTELDRAIGDENFELAASLRDQINSLETALDEGSNS